MNLVSCDRIYSTIYSNSIFDNSSLASALAPTYSELISDDSKERDIVNYFDNFYW